MTFRHYLLRKRALAAGVCLLPKRLKLPLP
jgi:hypothetical protein